MLGALKGQLTLMRKKMVTFFLWYLAQSFPTFLACDSLKGHTTSIKLGDMRETDFKNGQN